MSTQTIELSTADGPMEVYEATPDGAQPKAAIIVIQEAFGVNDHIEDVARRFADQGYHAVAPAIFHRAGGGTAPYDDFSKVMPLFEGLTDDGVLIDIDATLEHLHEAGFERRQHRHRRILLRRPGHVPRGGAAHDRRGCRLLRRRDHAQQPGHGRSARAAKRRRCRRRGSGCSATTTR